MGKKWEKFLRSSGSCVLKHFPTEKQKKEIALSYYLISGRRQQQHKRGGMKSVLRAGIKLVLWGNLQVQRHLSDFKIKISAECLTFTWF